MVTKKKNILLTLQIDEETHKQLTSFAELSNTTKATLVRDLIDDKLEEMRIEFENNAINDFINARLNKDKFENVMKLSQPDYKTPKDLIQARQEVINKIKGGKK